MAATASLAEIKRRYRHLAKKIHPDVLPRGGAAGSPAAGLDEADATGSARATFAGGARGAASAGGAGGAMGADRAANAGGVTPGDAASDRAGSATPRAGAAAAPAHQPGRSSAEQAFVVVQHAYEVLSDPARRAAYDRQLAAKMPRRTGDERPQAGRTAQATGAAAAAVEQDPGTRSGPAPRGAAGTARTILADLWLELDLPRRADERRAPSTDRSGQAGAAIVELSVEQAYTGAEVDIGPLRVKIPPGARHQMRFKVPGPVWDVETFIKPHRRYRVYGDDLEVEVKVPRRTASAGGEIRVPHPTSGHLTTRVPAGLRNGQALRLRGRGLPATATRQAGDLVMRVRIPGAI